MVTFGFNQQKCKTQCQLCAGRIKLMRNKRSVKLRGLRKDIGGLLRAGKTDLAQIRVEGIMRDEAILHAYEVVELYVETVKLRVAAIDRSREIPEDMLQAITTIIYASQHMIDVPELEDLRTRLASKYGKSYAREAADATSAHMWKVHPQIERWFTSDPPTLAEKRASLKDIAREYQIVWDTDEADQQLRSYLLGPSAADAGRTRPGAPISVGQHSYDSRGDRGSNPRHYNHNAASASTVYGATVPLQPPPIGSYQRSIQQSSSQDSSRFPSLLQRQQQQLRQDQQQPQRSEPPVGGHSRQQSRDPFDSVGGTDDDGLPSPSVYFYSPEQQAEERRRLSHASRRPGGRSRSSSSSNDYIVEYPQAGGEEDGLIKYPKAGGVSQAGGRSCSSSSSSDGIVEYPYARGEEDGVVKYPKAGAPSERHTSEDLDDMDANDTKSPAHNYYASRYQGDNRQNQRSREPSQLPSPISPTSDIMNAARAWRAHQASPEADSEETRSFQQQQQQQQQQRQQQGGLNSSKRQPWYKALPAYPQKNKGTSSQLSTNPATETGTNMQSTQSSVESDLMARLAALKRS